MEDEARLLHSNVQYGCLNKTNSQTQWLGGNACRMDNLLKCCQKWVWFSSIFQAIFHHRFHKVSCMHGNYICGVTKIQPGCQSCGSCGDKEIQVTEAAVKVYKSNQSSRLLYCLRHAPIQTKTWFEFTTIWIYRFSTCIWKYSMLRCVSYVARVIINY